MVQGRVLSQWSRQPAHRSDYSRQYRFAPSTRCRSKLGGRRIDDLIAEVDAGLASYERMLVLFKNEAAAEVMMASPEMDLEEAPRGAA
jgi:hypothetical protein